MGNLVVVATMRLKPGVREEYVRHLADHRRRCLASEPGTIAFEILAPHEEPDTVMLYEIYTDKAAFDAHIAGESMGIMKSKTAGMLTKITGIPCEQRS